ncbi:hypothetical protein GJ688_13215 [Heliobacillus mobilis]|uniref:Uncharacterized protein n=1 Tax=Heliobacterium mobile TaxID=28064 RepID=A0A6I3SLW2_HELMO|nr:hypothetical protein [Heliobacterium mobile]MTV49934.1 hypothetical protein [Heliobacterium mobile]
MDRNLPGALQNERVKAEEIKIATDEKSIWNDYFFLTKQMLWALRQKNMELFSDMLVQREGMQNRIERGGWKGQGAKIGMEATRKEDLLNQIAATNEEIKHELILQMSELKRQIDRFEAYHKIEMIEPTSLMDHRG